MNANLHPVFQQALAPYMARTIADSGSIEYEWEVNPLLKINCKLDYVEAEKGGREHGVQIEPDYPSNMTLLSAWIGTTNIMPLLSDDQIVEIEVMALAMYERG